MKLDYTAPLPDLLRTWMTLHQLKAREAGKLLGLPKQTVDSVLYLKSSGANFEGPVRKLMMVPLSQLRELDSSTP
jgi:hypothetical protein